MIYNLLNTKEIKIKICLSSFKKVEFDVSYLPPYGYPSFPYIGDSLSSNSTTSDTHNIRSLSTVDTLDMLEIRDSFIENLHFKYK